MKKTHNKPTCGNPYATNKGGKIESPRNPAGGDPKSGTVVATRNTDLRNKQK